MTTRGLGVDEMIKIAEWMRRVADLCVKAENEDGLDQYENEVERNS